MLDAEPITTENTSNVSFDMIVKAAGRTACQSELYCAYLISASGFSDAASSQCSSYRGARGRGLLAPRAWRATVHRPRVRQVDARDRLAIVPGIQPADVQELIEHGARAVVLVCKISIGCRSCPEPPLFRWVVRGSSTTPTCGAWCKARRAGLPAHLQARIGVRALD